MSHPAPDADTTVATLANGVRVVAIRLPWLDSAAASVFVRAGSAHEQRHENGISHVVEHMAFKGTESRSCQQINLDAERLGAEVNAHTDKDHTAFHMRGRARDAERFVAMLADIVRHGTFPEAELERERGVILQEYLEDEDDALSAAFKLFDRLCFGNHPVAQPVIGTRHNIQRFTRADLLDFVERHYRRGDSIVVGVAGNIDPQAIVRAAEAAFGSMPAGTPETVAAPVYEGGTRLRRIPGNNQAHIVVGYPIPGLAARCQPAIVAAALLGEGMSSPLLDQLRERRGLVYYTACSADVLPWCGQFVIEASTGPEHLDAFCTEVARLLVEQAERILPVDLERARNQIAVRALRTQEQPYRRLEEAALDLFVHGRVRPRAEVAAAIESVSADEVREAFAAMLRAGGSVAITGQVARSAQAAAERLAKAGR